MTLNVNRKGFTTKNSSFFGCEPSKMTILYNIFPINLENRVSSRELLVQNNDNPCNNQLNNIIAASFQIDKIILISNSGVLQYQFPTSNKYLLSIPSQIHNLNQIVSPASSSFIFALREKELCVIKKINIKLEKCFSTKYFKNLNLSVEFFRESDRYLYVYDSPPISGGNKDPFIFTLIQF